MLAYIDGTDEIFVAHEDVRHGKTKDNGQYPCADEAFNGLFRRKLDELRAAEGDAADVSEDIIGDHQRCGQEEPDHPLEDIIHDEVRLHNDEIKRHVRPSELRELEAIVTLFEGANEEDKACPRR